MRLVDQAEIGDKVAHQAMRQDRKILDDEGNFAGLEDVDEFVAVRVAAIEHRERAPFGSGAMQALDFARDPLRLGIVGGMRDDPHLAAVFANRRERVLRNIYRLFVMADGLARDAQNAAGRTVIERERPQ